MKARIEKQGSKAESGRKSRLFPVPSKTGSLWKIAKELLGSGSRWNELYEANRDVIRNPNKIYVGLELAIPG